VRGQILRRDDDRGRVWKREEHMLVVHVEAVVLPQEGRWKRDEDSGNEGAERRRRRKLRPPFEISKRLWLSGRWGQRI
jgi:hypothetical protein